MNSYTQNYSNYSQSSPTEKYNKLTKCFSQTSCKDDYILETIAAENDFNDSNHYTPDHVNDNDLKISDKSSMESLFDSNTNINPVRSPETKERYRSYSSNIKQSDKLKDAKYSEFINNKRTAYKYETNVHKIFPNFNENKHYEPINDSKGILAKQKLEKLKELQRRRDALEKYYSYEIKRIFDDSRPPTETSSAICGSPREKIISQTNNHDYVTSDSDNLKSCGTITTITRLDCGCMERMTRQIFTTTVGHVQKRNCSPAEQVYTKIASPTTSFIHTTPTVSKFKSKSFSEHISSHDKVDKIYGNEEPPLSHICANLPTRNVNKPFALSL